VVTFKNSSLGEVINQTGLNRIVLETDAPYLTPAPFRGKRNETAYTRLVAEKIAIYSGLTLDEVARVTSSNAHKLFKTDA
jgi:TatD DNase family protein